MRSYGFKAKDSELDAVFNSFDCIDKNGTVSFHELMQVLRVPMADARNKNDLRRSSIAAGRQFDETDVAAIAVDASAGLDSRVGRKAFREQLRDALQSNGARVIDAFRQWDADGSGTLDVLEVCVCASASTASSDRTSSLLLSLYAV